MNKYQDQLHKTFGRFLLIDLAAGAQGIGTSVPSSSIGRTLSTMDVTYPGYNYGAAGTSAASSSSSSALPPPAPIAQVTMAAISYPGLTAVATQHTQHVQYPAYGSVTSQPPPTTKLQDAPELQNRILNMMKNNGMIGNGGGPLSNPVGVPPPVPAPAVVPPPMLQPPVASYSLQHDVKATMPQYMPSYQGWH